MDNHLKLKITVDHKNVGITKKLKMTINIEIKSISETFYTTFASWLESIYIYLFALQNATIAILSAQ
jgi:hypothetical protein